MDGVWRELKVEGREEVCKFAAHGFETCVGRLLCRRAEASLALWGEYCNEGDGEMPREDVRPLFDSEYERGCPTLAFQGWGF
jgi:hypothetical protein